MPEDNNEYNSDETEEIVEVLEFAIGNEEIDELITKLNELKQTKKSIEFEIDEENELLIHHEEDEELNLPDSDEDDEEEIDENNKEGDNNENK